MGQHLFRKLFWEVFKASCKERCCIYLSNSHFMKVRREEEKNIRDRQAITCTPPPWWPSSESKGKQYGSHRSADEACTNPNRHTVHLISKATMSWHVCKVGDKALVCGLQQGHLPKHIAPALMRQLKVSLTAPVRKALGHPKGRPDVAGLAKVVTGAIPESMPCSRNK